MQIFAWLSRAQKLIIVFPTNTKYQVLCSGSAEHIIGLMQVHITRILMVIAEMKSVISEGSYATES